MNGAEKYKKIWDDTLKIFEQSGNVTGVIRPLKSARFKFFSPDDKTFYIETNDIFNAELLSDRATVQLTRILQGFTDNLDYLIKFIPPDSPTITEYAEIPAAPPTEKLINLTWVHNSIRDIVLQPEKVMSIPRYLFRWMPYTSPSAILLWISLYQIYYLKNSGKRIFDRDQSINTTYDEMSRWSGLSAITIKRMFKDGDKIKWFLNRGQNQYVTRPDGSVRPQLNIRFMKPGLTPGDASDLSNWLLAHNMISNPEECLKLALSKQPRDI